MMVETRPVGCGLLGFGLCWLSLFFSPPSDCSSLPSTMTWAPCPHGVRTHEKKITPALHGAVRLCRQSALSSKVQAEEKQHMAKDICP